MIDSLTIVLSRVLFSLYSMPTISGDEDEEEEEHEH